jgi:hypothetical protein
VWSFKLSPSDPEGAPASPVGHCSRLGEPICRPSVFAGLRGDLLVVVQPPHERFRRESRPPERESFSGKPLGSSRETLSQRMADPRFVLLVLLLGFTLPFGANGTSSPPSGRGERGERGTDGRPLSLRQHLSGKLPSKLQGLFPGKTSQSAAEKSLGPPAEKGPHGVSYYETSGIRFDTALQFRNSLLSSLTYQWPGRAETLDSLSTWIGKSKIDEAYRLLLSQLRTGTDPRSGRSLNLEFPEEGLLLEFSTMGEKRLKKATFLVQEEAKVRADSPKGRGQP